ncbi:ester cyclase [Methanoculleus sp. FWC-SCC1]|uniref:Ester cyclase n=1 Tax=Methanoculleus frigidifontis TaxID=2584085 RepID=A0ABT8M985_9EURY|nr:ester cyclase [Methanoculleus sp. FWC-SCC1]MDN7024502.1 ester cyclase [Methanoculleus sp. FWC-SCC1]
MSPEESKAIVRRFIEAYNTRNLDVFDDLVAPDYVDHTHRQQGRENFRQLFTLAFEGFPDWHERIEDIIAEGDTVWVRVTATGTHTGEWSLSGVPLPPTGRKVTMRMVFIWRLENGRLAEGREVDEDLEFLRQLGVIEYTETGRRIFPEAVTPER